MASRPKSGERVVICRCPECGRWEGEKPQAGCCPGCGHASEPEQWVVSLVGRIAPDPPAATVARILSEPRGKPWTPPPGIKTIPFR